MPPEVWVLPTLHPSRVLRGGYALEPAQRTTLLRVRETLADLDAGTTPRHYYDTTQPPPGAITAPRLSDLYTWAKEPLDEGIAVDIECAGEHLRGIGFCTLSTLVPLWLPFWRQGKQPYWPNYAQLRAAVGWAYNLLASPIPKVFHNGVGFDVPYLLREYGFVVGGEILDTIVLANAHHPEMPKSLQWLSTYHLGTPNWKSLSEEDEENDK